MNLRRNILYFMILSLLSACATSSPDFGKPTSQPGAVKIGNPYEIAGKTYYPSANPDYNEVGIASWYGDEFHGRQTANGEVFNMNDLSAAHTTLPLPSYVRVTNLENNRSLILRVNDRGPFVGDRLIDVSRRSAQLLGFEKKGTTRVRVELVPDANAPIQIARSSEPPPIPKQDTGIIAVEQLDDAGPPTTQPRPRQMASLPQQPTAIINQANIQSTFVQVGAYSQISNAQKAITSVKHIGEINLESIELNGQKLYRVKVGPLPTTTTANVALAEVLRLGHNTAKLVSD
jgi:rare lipoprotein A